MKNESENVITAAYAIEANTKPTKEELKAKRKADMETLGASMKNTCKCLWAVIEMPVVAFTTAAAATAGIIVAGKLLTKNSTDNENEVDENIPQDEDIPSDE